jgi:hypothetical protein
MPCVIREDLPPGSPPVRIEPAILRLQIQMLAATLPIHVHIR